MEDRLRECPCGHEAHIIFEDGIKVADPWSVACKKFDCPWVFQTFPSREKAISEWNTRAADPLLEKMARALESVIEPQRMKNLPTKKIYERAVQALQKYREMKDAK